MNMRAITPSLSKFGYSLLTDSVHVWYIQQTIVRRKERKDLRIFWRHNYAVVPTDSTCSWKKTLAVARGGQQKTEVYRLITAKYVLARSLFSAMSADGNPGTSSFSSEPICTNKIQTDFRSLLLKSIGALSCSFQIPDLNSVLCTSDADDQSFPKFRELCDNGIKVYICI